MLFLCKLAFFKHNFHKKREEVCIKTRSTSASRSLKGWDTTLTTVKWSIKKKIRVCVFTSSIKRHIKKFHVVVGLRASKMCKKSVIHMQSCCLAYEIYRFFDVLDAVVVVVA